MAGESKPYLIGVAGPSCSGKTELSRSLVAQLDATLVQLDWYYFDLSGRSMEDRARVNFDAPAALDETLFFQQLHELATGNTIERPVYDFATHTRLPQVERVAPSRYIVVEGLFVLYWERVRQLFGTKVFVDLDDDVCLERRICRDTRERGRTRESVVRQFRETVVPMARLYVRPARTLADIVVPGDNPMDSNIAVVMAHIERYASRPAANQAGASR